MTAGSRDPGGGPSEHHGPVAGPGGPNGTSGAGGFAGELAAAFRRHRPQGSARWNFSAAFTRLEERYGSRREAPGLATHPEEAGPAGEGTVGPDVGAAGGQGAGPPGAPGGGEAAKSLLHRLADRYVTDRVQPWVAEQAAVTANRVAKETLDSERRAAAEGFGAALEAFRFLGSRVERLEDSAARRDAPVDAVGNLVVPTPLTPWTDPVVGWLRGSVLPGAVLHAECGDGELAVALSTAGVEVRGIEPRGAVAWRAADRGVSVEVGEVPDLLPALPSGSLGGLVLSGVVDRAPLDVLVSLVDAAVARLAPAAPLVVVGTRPETVVEGWDAVARDLLPGRPLHPETWELLLARAGFVDVGRLGPTGGGGDLPSYAVKARRSA